MTATGLAGPLATTLARLHALDAWLIAEVGRPEGQEWYALDTVVTGGHLDAWLDALARDKGGHREVAGAYLGSWLAGALVDVPMAALVTERRLPNLGSELWLHRHSEGWFDGVAFASAKLTMVAGDPDEGSGDAAVIADREVLYDLYALQLVDRLSPLLRAVRRRAPFGLRGLWEAVADEVSGRALSVARLSGADEKQAWAEAQTILDRVAAHQDQLRTRPRPFPVTWSGGEALFQVKGTCCLYYKTQGGPLDPRGDGCCTTCPLRADDDRARRLRRHLQHPEN